jgi:hypothetical protein
MPVLFSDARSTWDESLMPDPRASHFWDEERVTGIWFNEQGYLAAYNLGLVYDAYILFGPEAKWDSKPSPVVSEGYTIIGMRPQLQEDILPLLED